jgi:prepilin peptidase CpaA
MTDLLELTPWRTWLVIGALGAVLVAAAVSDLRDRTVPNALTYPAVGVGLVVQTVAFGWAGLAAGSLAVLVLFVISLLLVFVPALGGGDLKLIIATGAFLGLERMAPLMFYAVWVGFAMGVLQAIAGGYLRAMGARMWSFIKGLGRAIWYQTTQVADTYEPPEESSIPFAVAMLAGGVLAYTEAVAEWPGLWIWYLAQFS